MWSASSPWPVISWKRTPPKPPPTTTGIEPEGAGTASSRVSALRRRLLGDLAGVVFEQLEAAVGAERLGAGLDRAVAAGDRLGADPDAGAVVAGEEAVGVGDGDLAAGLGVGGGELGDLGALARAPARRARAAAPPCARPATSSGRRSIGSGVVCRACSGRGSRALAAQRRGGLVGGALEVGRVEAVDVGEVGGVAVDHAHPGALLGAGLDRLDPRLVDRQRQPAAPFGEDLGEAAAVGERAGEHALGDVLVDQLAHARRSSCFASRRPRSARPAATKSSAPLLESLGVVGAAAVGVVEAGEGRRAMRRRRMKAAASSA